MKRSPLKGIKIVTQIVPNMILYNEKNPKDNVILRTRAVKTDLSKMDFLFSSDKKQEQEQKNIFSINITVVIYESDVHHSLLEYKIKFVEKDGAFKMFHSTEFIGDTLVIF